MMTITAISKATIRRKLVHANSQMIHGHQPIILSVQQLMERDLEVTRTNTCIPHGHQKKTVRQDAHKIVIAKVLCTVSLMGGAGSKP